MNTVFTEQELESIDHHLGKNNNYIGNICIDYLNIEDYLSKVQALADWGYRNKICQEWDKESPWQGLRSYDPAYCFTTSYVTWKKDLVRKYKQHLYGPPVVEKEKPRSLLSKLLDKWRW